MPSCRAVRTPSCCRRRRAAPASSIADAKLTAREAIARHARRPYQDRGDRDRDGDRAVPRRHVSRRERAARRSRPGAPRIYRPSSARKRTATATAVSSIPTGSRARSASPGAAAAQVQAIDTVDVDFRNVERPAPRDRRGAARRLHRQDGDPSGAGAGHQRGVHADAGSDRARPRAVIAAFEAKAGEGVVGIGGVMYDRPHLERAQAVARTGERGGRANVGWASEARLTWCRGSCRGLSRRDPPAVLRP